MPLSAQSSPTEPTMTLASTHQSLAVLPRGKPSAHTISDPSTQRGVRREKSSPQKQQSPSEHPPSEHPQRLEWYAPGEAIRPRNQ